MTLDSRDRLQLDTKFDTTLFRAEDLTLVAPIPWKQVSVPKGEIAVDLEKNHVRLTADVTLPPGITGEFEWRGAKHKLVPGANHLVF